MKEGWVYSLDKKRNILRMASAVSGSAQAWDYSYDGRGRLVTKNQGSYQARYNYRFGDKLKDVASNFPGEAATVYYNYDGLGKRRCKTLDSVTCTW